MTEYEYSIEVKSLKPYIDYCINNGYVFIEENQQQRIIFRNKNKTMARITINERDGNVIKQIDFKEDNLKENVFERRESLSLEYKDDKAIKSILDFLEYSEDNTLIRKRYVYEKEGLKFELDEYTQPRITCVVGIEGEKEKVNKVVEQIKKLIL